MESIFINGDFVVADRARIDPSDRGFTLGDGVFDTMLALEGDPVDADAHYARLARHAAAMGIPLLPTLAEFLDYAGKLLRGNGLGTGRAAVRTTLTRGPGPRGLAIQDKPEPTLMMRAAPAPAAAGPVTLVIADSVRRNEGSPLSRIKSLNYGDNILALREARARGADDAVLLNNAGKACCASASNIFAVIGKEWITPPLTDGVLDGLTRAKIMKEREVREMSLTAADLMRADAVYISNSLTGLRQGRFPA